MMLKLREFFETTAGKITSGVLICVGLLIAFLSMKSNLGEGDAAAISRSRIFVCSETGKSFTKEIDLGDSIPMVSPFSGKPTGFPAELCYWTSDGTPTDEPTAVLLNSYAGKSEPTFCPDCKRLVTARNSVPSPDGTPPPTETEYKNQRTKLE